MSTSLRLHWLSPLPPQQSEISAYSTHVLERLLRDHEVTVWVPDDRQDWTVPPAAIVRPFTASPDTYGALNRGDMVFFSLGNNAKYHRWIWEASQQVPGVVIVHDPAVQHLLSEVLGRAEHHALMYREYGAEGLHAAARYWDGRTSLLELAERYPLTDVLLENALAAVVHWPGAISARRDAPPIRCLALPYPTQAHVPRASPIGARSPLRLVIIGFLGANRRLEAIFDALAGLEERDRVELHICGAASPGIEIAAMIAARRLTGVTVHGYVPAKELDAILRTADMIINLRGPTMREVSASQLRAWDYSLPTMVSRTGWYATIPESAVAFVDAGDPVREVEDIRRHIREMLANPERFAAMGRAGRALLESAHTADAYAGGLVALATDRESLRAQWAKRCMADRLGRLAAGMHAGRDTFAESARAIALLPG